MGRPVALTVHLDAARARQTPGPAKHLDALPLEVGRLGPVLVLRHHEVAPREGTLRSDTSAHRLAGARRLARRLQRLARPQQRLRRDTGPIVTLTPDQPALHNRHPKARVSETPRTMLARRTGTDNDDVERSHDAVVGDARNALTWAATCSGSSPGPPRNAKRTPPASTNRVSAV